MRRGEAFVAKGIGAGFSSVGEGGANNLDEGGFMWGRDRRVCARREGEDGGIDIRSGAKTVF